MTKSEIKSEYQHSVESAIATVGAAISDISRVKILCALMDGRAWTATELGIAADISASTTSSHLSKLLSRGLISVISQGKYRYFRLANDEIAKIIENLMYFSPNHISQAKITTPKNLRKARTCYNHLAGEIAVDIYDSLCRQKWITEDGHAITALGVEQFKNIGIELHTKHARNICCPCLDWSERRFHLGGQIGATFLNYAEAQAWLIRHQGYREVTISKKGYKALTQYFNVKRKEEK
ncbi:MULTISPECIES: ArsR/SmtB family transcription factor [Proteus]|jgi:DNA-binding transcriptional ArsR family regulator|uniref:ArsR family transcriptional regulator n=2 Tax=Proteus vulgaris TaxID=585 RepID=A0A379FEB5_PROVU|nr:MULTISPECIES: winged helix-turn-helix domain-containing protein [Proteus]RNT29185.1 ArsR family transcriptional regulator [Proteus mirabilis]KGA59485.1 bacterial regulatory, arsR family protein [Proteus vulgaris]MBG5971930.1 winged helix-turn-helix transcriptional regulator [Proteus vulgaris]MBG5983331.1 winged helix-turn-helix transcriptional regulator [Proteus vulgaris]MBI6510202.1 winged helix-turn-helix transcriptional regulator [Proteus sp. PR00174]